MPASTSLHVKPFVYETPDSAALHFSICEIQSRMNLQDPTALNLEYTRTMMGFLLLNPAPKHIVMVGLGGGSLAKFILRHLPRTRLQVVEINPHVIALRNDFKIPPDDGRFQVLRGDGAQFVRDNPAPCDVLLVDGFDDQGMPDGLASQRFYDDCHAMLQPDGLLVANLHAGDARYPVLLKRIGRSFEGAALTVEGSDLSNSIVFACKGLALDRFKPGAMRRPAGLDDTAAQQLLASFALVASALKDRLNSGVA